MTNASGKYVIIAILSVALAAAGTAWWFRYNATRRAVGFWGPQAARLIRDAPIVMLERVYPATASKVHDISKAPGLTHLRNALLEDRSFRWEQEVAMASKAFIWKLQFSDPISGDQLAIHFAENCRAAARGDNGQSRRVVSTEPISEGLREVFAEFSADPAESAR